VKLATEDNPQAPDDFLLLLCHLWRHDISINNQPVKGQIAIMGSSEQLVIEWVQRHYSQAEHWLPGRCDGCTQWVMERTESYWGAHPHFCFKCLAWTIEYFERNQKWPEGNWFPGETFSMDELEGFGEEE
jgi:hypothetical protein